MTFYTYIVKLNNLDGTTVTFICDTLDELCILFLSVIDDEDLTIDEYPVSGTPGEHWFSYASKKSNGNLDSEVVDCIAYVTTHNVYERKSNRRLHDDYDWVRSRYPRLAVHSKPQNVKAFNY